MLISHFDKKTTSNSIKEIYLWHLDLKWKKSYDRNFSDNPQKFLEMINKKIKNFKNTPDYFLSESNRTFFHLLLLKEYATKILFEKNKLIKWDKNNRLLDRAKQNKLNQDNKNLEDAEEIKNSNNLTDDPEESASEKSENERPVGDLVSPNSISKNDIDNYKKVKLKHAAELAKVPHKIGKHSISAFLKGIKGEALPDNHGEIKINNYNDEWNFSEHSDIRKFHEYATSQIKEHFFEYSPEEKTNIYIFINQLLNAGMTGNYQTKASVAKAMNNIGENPFKNVNEKIRPRLINYFYNIYLMTNKKESGLFAEPEEDEEGNSNNQDNENLSPKRFDNNVVNDALSALHNLGYDKKESNSMVKQALMDDPSTRYDLTKMLSAVFRKSQK